MTPRTFPKGSTTEAVTNPASPWRVSASYSFAPMDTNRSRAAARAGRRRGGGVAAVDQAQLVSVVADAKVVVSRAFEVRVDAQKPGIPLFCRLEIVRPVVDGGE